MATLTSSSFNITVNKSSDTTSMNSMISSPFSITINKSSDTTTFIATSTIQILKGTEYLVAVDDSPSEGQFSFSIDSCIGCTASKADSNKVGIVSITDNTAFVKISLNVENSKTYIKQITVMKTKQGEDGISVEDVIIQYAKNTSTTTPPTSGWSTSMPTYEEGYYLWYRIGVKYSNRDDYVYSDPVCDESWKVYQEVYTQYKQLSDKFTWLVKSGDSESTMQLTDRLFELVSQNITLTADHINLNGYVSNDNANWSIDNEGNMRAENLKIEGEVGADTLSVNYIDNPCYPATLAGSVHLYVNTDSGNDDYTLDDILRSYDEAEEKSNDALKKKFKTLQGALDANPAFLNNKNLRITLETDTTEDVYVRGFTSGAVRIYLNGKTIYGNVHGYANSAAVYLYGGTVDNTTATQGIIHPNIGFNFASRCVSVGFDACQYVALYKVKVFGADNKPSSVSSDDKVAVASAAGTGSIYCSDVEITNCAIGFRANNMGCIHAAKSSGKASRYGFESTTGGQISLADANQVGGAIANTSESHGGQVWFKSPTFDGNTTSTDTTTAPVTSTTKTMTIKSTYGDTYRSTVYNSWKKDGTARQGNYGYGDCTGCWFFGTAFSELKGYTISKVQITITRNSGGRSSAVGLVVRTHNYSARPSGVPELSSPCGTLSLATGATGTLTVSDSTVLNGIKDGIIKGFGIRTSYDAAHYAVCSGNVTVKITYTE